MENAFDLISLRNKQSRGVVSMAFGVEEILLSKYKLV
jgi:hypothetical protein